MDKTTWSLFVVALIALVASGCATQDTTALRSAQAAYTQAQANPTVAANAPVTLYEAGQSLQKAEQAGNAAEQRHYAYLAQRQAQQAVSEAEQKQAENQMGQLGQQRQQIIIQSREQEAARARAQAQTEAERAQMSAQQAQMAREQEMQARGEAAVAQQQAQTAQQQATQLESQLSELKARETNRGVTLTMSDVMFATGQATITPGGMLSLDKLAGILKQNPNEKVLIEGHTDNTGSPAFNQELSQRRADAVRNALMERGVSADRITARGYGEEFPVASNANPAGRQQNRRVDIVITG